MSCPLCNLDLTKEKIFYEDPLFVVLRTKDMKGHNERLMIVYKRHEHRINGSEMSHAIDKLAEIGMKVFGASKFVIMDNTYATIQQHWHLVATDLSKFADDIEQILNTRWLAVVDRTWFETLSLDG